MKQRLKPPWLKVRLPASESYGQIKKILRQRQLYTVCEEAHCPNIGECWETGTATFMLMGDVCTRGCRFCAVKSGKPLVPPDPNEPQKLAEAVAEMNLDYVVLTSVDRDDLPDGGASHFAKVIQTIKQTSPHTLVEALIPDFQGSYSALDKVIRAGAEVIAHNIETVERLTPTVRDQRATYQQSLQVLSCLKKMAPHSYTKSSLMLGLGETLDELKKTLRDLRTSHVDILTIGQYLQPTQKHAPVHEFVTPECFEQYKQEAEDLGFLYVASGPLVRSSYRAGEFFVKSMLERSLKR